MHFGQFESPVIVACVEETWTPVFPLSSHIFSFIHQVQIVYYQISSHCSLLSGLNNILLSCFISISPYFGTV
jgi:hypothetical protein